MEQETIIMDIRGQICPSCLLLTLKQVNENIEQLKQNEAEIRVLSDDRHASSTIPEAVEKMGLSTSVEKTAGGFEIRIFKKG
jgi:TusA-related sulfurtransferase